MPRRQTASDRIRRKETRAKRRGQRDEGRETRASNALTPSSLRPLTPFSLRPQRPFRAHSPARAHPLHQHTP